MARNHPVPKLAHAVSAKGLAGVAFPVRVAAVDPDSGTLLVAVLLAAFAIGGEDTVFCACAFVATSVCAVLSGFGNSVFSELVIKTSSDLYTDPRLAFLMQVATAPPTLTNTSGSTPRFGRRISLGSLVSPH